MGPTPVYGARAEKPPKNADFAMKQTNICRLSGDITKKQTKKDKLGPVAPRAVRPPLPKFSGYVEVDAPDIFHASTIWVRPLFTELGPKNPPCAVVPIKQTNICRLSGDITMENKKT